jgi:hypothetical protein
MMHFDKRQLILNLHWLMENNPLRYQQALIMLKKNEVKTL